MDTQRRFGFDASAHAAASHRRRYGAAALLALLVAAAALAHSRSALGELASVPPATSGVGSTPWLTSIVRGRIISE
ncbi:MAG: hypothetical protein SGJ11_00690 [Phycisphaerae bacterium]|nr:hypothetical protein [Phycisphaerae bacterium]